MPHRFDTRAEDFAPRFAAFLAAKREASIEVGEEVARIIADVRRRGDEALIELSRRFDGADLKRLGIRVAPERLIEAERSVAPDLLAALRLAAERIEAHHRRQLPESGTYRDALGVTLGQRWTAVEAAGLYVPGGTASYPSSVLMNAIPAKVAGVPRLAMVVPYKDGALNPLVLAAARVAGVDEVHTIGGAQAIAALAFGTKSVVPVAKVVGPGNAYVAAAKRQVFGTVGIDMIAGPSEVLVIADRDNDPDWIAADLIAQAEHDRAAQSILVTDDAGFAAAVEAAVERQLAGLARGDIATASWQEFGAVILVDDLDEAVPLADRIAAEHLEIATRDPEALAGRIRNAGAIFLGAHTPEVIGDYVAGSNHVLPTARSARFSSGLGVLDFMKRTSLLKLDAASLGALAPAAMALARAEGLDGHRNSVAIRLGAGKATKGDGPAEEGGS